MASLPWFIVLLIGIVVGTLLGIVIIALMSSNKPTENLCPRCKNETEEEKQLKQEWTEQQKGY
jgi:uncharacterized membrane-anchored protein YhcB (DUF1043 family)